MADTKTFKDLIEKIIVVVVGKIREALGLWPTRLINIDAVGELCVDIRRLGLRVPPGAHMKAYRESEDDTRTRTKRPVTLSFSHEPHVHRYLFPTDVQSVKRKTSSLFPETATVKGTTSSNRVLTPSSRAHTRKVAEEKTWRAHARSQGDDAVTRKKPR